MAKTKKQKLRSQADRLWFNAIFKKYGTQCEICPTKASQAHHFYPKGLYGHLRYDLDNGIQICKGHHFAHHHKADTSVHLKIIDKRGQVWLNNLRSKAHKRSKTSYLTLLYYRNIIKELEKYGTYK